jgi:DNA primase
MEEFSKVIKRKLTQYFKQKLNLLDYRGGWLKGTCPYCDKLKFGVNIHDNRANCFYCGPHGSPISVIMELEELPTRPEVYNLLGTFDGMDFLEPRIVQREWKTIELPESFRLLSFGNSLLSKYARNYVRGRGFKVDDLSARGIGYCTTGPYAGFIIFPFYQGGKLTFFQGRQFIQLWEKFKNPSVEDFGIGKSMLTYNTDSLVIYKKVYAVESIFNSLTIGDNSIVFLGKTISGYQLSMVYKSPVEELIIGFDPDAKAEAIKLGLDMVHLKKIKILDFPKNMDINDIGKKETKKIENKSPWLSYNDLLKLKNRYATSA